MSALLLLRPSYGDRSGFHTMCGSHGHFDMYFLALRPVIIFFRSQLRASGPRVAIHSEPAFLFQQQPWFQICFGQAQGLQQRCAALFAQLFVAAGSLRPDTRIFGPMARVPLRGARRDTTLFGLRWIACAGDRNVLAIICRRLCVPSAVYDGGKTGLPPMSAAVQCIQGETAGCDVCDYRTILESRFYQQSRVFREFTF